MARGRVSELFPLPFVGVVVLLAMLIFLTPNLLLGGAPTAGTIATQAQLTVDLLPGASTVHFYVQGFSTVRYAVLAALVATNTTWPAAPASNLTWTNASYGTEVLAAAFSATGLPLAVNVTATYVDAAGTAVTYWGLYGFNVVGTDLYTTPLDPRLPSVGATPLDALPLTLLLETEPVGGSP